MHVPTKMQQSYMPAHVNFIETKTEQFRPWMHIARVQTALDEIDLEPVDKYVADYPSKQDFADIKNVGRRHGAGLGGARRLHRRSARTASLSCCHAKLYILLADSE